jgi:F420-dependent methylenetetrahydromethanopterin dehydrogenase
MMRTPFFALAAFALTAPAAAQDIRGLEVCTAEKAMERRTGCLQSNVEFLQQALAKQARETKARLDTVSREAAAQKAELAALKSTLAKLQHELAEMKKAKPDKK